MFSLFAGLGCGGGNGPAATSVAGDSGSAPALCGQGSWTLLLTAGACGDCIAFEDSVGLVVPEQQAAEGGAVLDTEGNTWQFDPTTCVATMGGSCNSADTLNFDSGVATCTVVCDNACPPCQAPCRLTAGQ